MKPTEKILHSEHWPDEKWLLRYSATLDYMFLYPPGSFEKTVLGLYTVTSPLSGITMPLNPKKALRAARKYIRGRDKQAIRKAEHAKRVAQVFGGDL